MSWWQRTLLWDSQFSVWVISIFHNIGFWDSKSLRGISWLHVCIRRSSIFVSVLLANAYSSTVNLFYLKEFRLQLLRLWPICKECLKILKTDYYNRQIVERSLNCSLLDNCICHSSTYLMYWLRHRCLLFDFLTAYWVNCIPSYVKHMLVSHPVKNSITTENYEIVEIIS